jgi:hypothetical protein
MKHIQSILEGTWIELLPVTLTQEQQTLLGSTNSEDDAAKTALLANIKSQREGVLATEDATIAQAVYLANKPELQAGDTYQLIAVDMTLDNGATRGIINCRVNGEHKQIRF